MENQENKEQKEPTAETKPANTTLPPVQPIKGNAPKSSRAETVVQKDMANMQKPSEYMQFIDWTALPDTDRQPKTQKELAVILNVEEATLSDWKLKEGFWDLVRERVKSQWKGHLGKAVQALYLGLIQRKQAGEFQAFMQYVDDWSPKSKVEGDGLYDTSKIEVEIYQRRSEDLEDEPNYDKTEQDIKNKGDNSVGEEPERQDQIGS